MPKPLINFICWMLLLIICLGRIYFYRKEQKPFNEDDTIRISSRLINEPLRFESSQYFRLKGLKIYLPLYPSISYGDFVVIEGRVKGDKLANPILITLTKGEEVFALRRKLLEFYKRSLPLEDAALVSGMTIGSKSLIDESLWNLLRKSGTAHVVVASGMNITLVAKFLLDISLLIFKRKKALILTLSGVWFYALLSGGDAPVIRAAVMCTFAFLAQETGRLNSVLRVMAITFIVMVLVNPGYLSDVGFWLSFTSTFSIIVVSPFLTSYLNKVPVILREDLVTSLSAQAGVVPILMFYFGNYNFLSAIINVLVLWTVVPITLIGFAGGFIGLLIPIIGTYLVWLSYPLTSYFIFVISTALEF